MLKFLKHFISSFNYEEMIIMQGTKTAPYHKAVRIEKNSKKYAPEYAPIYVPMCIPKIKIKGRNR